VLYLGKKKRKKRRKRKNLLRKGRGKGGQRSREAGSIGLRADAAA